MLITPLGFEVSVLWKKRFTLLIDIFHFDWEEGATSLLRFGWWQG